MDKLHKQVVTTYPVAIKSGQSRLRVASPIPWHARCENMKCPDFETVFIVTDGFPKVQFLETLNKHHEIKIQHPNYIASEPEWTKIADCACGW
jgi:hypothetical protein